MPNIEAAENCCAPNGKMVKCGPCIIAAGLITVVLVIVIACVADGFHKISEGYVGIYFKYGALQDGVTMPGIQYKQPFVSSYQEIKIRPQTDTTNVGAVTQDGIEIQFNGIQIMNGIQVGSLIPMVKKFGLEFKQALVYDRIKEELRIYCANHTINEVYNTKFLKIVAHVKENVISSIEDLGFGGIDVLNVVIPKPDIPQDIARNYKQVKVQWTQQLVATQEQKTAKIKKQTESINAIADAEREKAVLEIKIKEKVLDKKGDEEISSINNKIVKDKEENIANIEKYKIEKQAEANTALYTPEYVKLNLAKALAANTKFYFSGGNSVMGGLLDTFLENKG